MINRSFDGQHGHSDFKAATFQHAHPALFVAAIFSVVLVAAALSRAFELVLGELVWLYGAIAIFLACGLRLMQLSKREESALKRKRLVVVANCFAITGLFYFIAATAALSCSALARTAFPYVDNALAAADLFLGFDWPLMMAWFQTSPKAAKILINAYVTLNWQPQILIILLCIYRSNLEAYRFITAWSVCLLLTIIAFPFVPAVAAFHHYGVNPAQMPGETAWASWHLKEIMEGLRSGANATLGTAELTGIITMPSFHAASAVLLMYAFWSFKWLRWPFALLNVIMFFSAVPVGGHYLVDTLAGLILAVLAIIIATRLHDRIADKAATEYCEARHSFA